MKNVKKTLLLALSFVLVAALSIVGTLAYLTSTAQDVNTMTYGNVHIAQHEYERAENGELQEFTQGKPLYPVTGTKAENDGTVSIDKPGTNGSMNVVKGLNNVQDKFVLVENTGKNNAYVRTIVAYEIGNLDETRFEDVIKTKIGSSWTPEKVGVTEIGGNNYYLVEYAYNAILESGKYTADNSLGQVYMASEATNEDCEALDGNGNGTYDILVFSQAVQADGFTDAEAAFDASFKDTTIENHPWLDEANAPVFVSNVADLQSKLSSENSGYVVLNEDIEIVEPLEVVGNKTLDLNGNRITTKGTNVINVSNADAELTITGNGTIESTNNTANANVSVINVKAGTVNINSGAFLAADEAVIGRAVEVNGTGKVNINGGTFNGCTQAIAVFGNGTATINDGTITSTVAGVFVDHNAKVYINGGTYSSKAWNGRTFTLNKKDNNKNVVLEVRGGTFINYDPSDSDSENPHANFVADGYKVTSETKNDKTYYTVTAE